MIGGRLELIVVVLETDRQCRMRLTREAWVAVAGLLVGFGLGMCIADFAIHWMAWDGATTAGMIGALTSFVGLGVMGVLSYRQRGAAPTSDLGWKPTATPWYEANSRLHGVGADADTV